MAESRGAKALDAKAERIILYVSQKFLLNSLPDTLEQSYHRGGHFKSSSSARQEYQDEAHELQQWLGAHHHITRGDCALRQQHSTWL